MPAWITDKGVESMGLSYVKWSGGGRNTFAPDAEPVWHAHRGDGMAHAWRDARGVLHAHPIAEFMPEHGADDIVYTRPQARAPEQGREARRRKIKARAALWRRRRLARAQGGDLLTGSLLLRLLREGPLFHG